jgi:hypothetical protein
MCLNEFQLRQLRGCEESKLKRKIAIGQEKDDEKGLVDSKIFKSG